MQYTETQLSKLIEDVEKEFTAHLAKAEEDFKSSKLAKSESTSDSAASVEPLVKAEEGEKKPEEKKPEAKEEHKEGGEEKPDHSKEAAPAQEKEAPKGDAEHAEPKGEPAQASEGADNQEGCDYDDEDHEHMHKMYLSMSKGELKAHHDSVKKALDHKGMAKSGEMSMSKSEENKTVAATEIVVPAQKPSPEIELLKSEIAAEKAKTDGLQKSLDAVSAFLTKLVEKKVAPVGKAITSLDVVAKSESVSEDKSLTKSEIDTILSKRAQDPKLEKSDRDAINAFYLNGASINSISHLLK